MLTVCSRGKYILKINCNFFLQRLQCLDQHLEKLVWVFCLTNSCFKWDTFECDCCQSPCLPQCLVIYKSRLPVVESLLEYLLVLVICHLFIQYTADVLDGRMVCCTWDIHMCLNRHLQWRNKIRSATVNTETQSEVQ